MPFTQQAADERAWRKRKARERAKSTKAYQQAMRPWYWRRPGLAIMLLVGATFLAYLMIFG